jgi:hypothetical protein
MSFEENRFCVYLHRRKDNNEVFYVGQGTLTRPYDTSRKNQRWRSVVDLVGYTVEIVKSGISKTDALLLERELIDKYSDQIVNRLAASSTIRELDFDIFNERFEVDETSPTGLSWRIDIRSGHKNNFIMARKGTPAGTMTVHGYYTISVGGKVYPAHRIVYLLVHGEVPTNRLIDHIDNNRANNKILNLRLASPKQNARNKALRNTNETGVNGVFYLPIKDAFVARLGIYVSDTRKNLSAFFACKKYGKEQALQLATAWRKEKEIEYGFNSNPASTSSNSR